MQPVQQESPWREGICPSETTTKDAAEVVARSEVRPEGNGHGAASPSGEATASQEAKICGEARPACAEETDRPATEEDEDQTRNAITPLHKSEWT